MNLNQTFISVRSIIAELPQLASEQYIRFAFVPIHYQDSRTNNYIKDFQIRIM